MGTGNVSIEKRSSRGVKSVTVIIVAHTKLASEVIVFVTGRWNKVWLAKRGSGLVFVTFIAITCLRIFVFLSNISGRLP